MRFFHTHTWRWTGTQWARTVVVEDLLFNPWTTADAKPSAGGPVDLLHAWRDGENGTVRWQRMDVANDMMVGAIEQFQAPHASYPVGLAIRSDDIPTFTFLKNGTMNAAQWSFQANNIGQLKAMNACTNGPAPLDLDTSDEMHATCRTDLFEDPPNSGIIVSEIRLYEENGVAMASTVVLDGFRWEVPDLAMVGDDAVVAAYNMDKDRIEVRWQEAGVWQGPVTIMDIPFPELVDSLAVDARAVGEDREIAVTARAGGRRIYYAEKSAGGVVSPRRRVDLFSDDDNLDCAAADEAVENVDVLLANPTDAWINWQVEHTGNNDDTQVSRFTSFRRADETNHTTPLNTNGRETTSLALRATGDNWTCFYDIDPADPTNKRALYVKYRDDPAIMVQGDTGVPAHKYTRGCSVGVDGFGHLHVVGGNVTTNRLVYRRRLVGLVWEPAYDIVDAHGVVPADGQIALAVEQQQALGGDLKIIGLACACGSVWLSSAAAQEAGQLPPNARPLPPGADQPPPVEAPPREVPSPCQRDCDASRLLCVGPCDDALRLVEVDETGAARAAHEACVDPCLDAWATCRADCEG